MSDLPPGITDAMIDRHYGDEGPCPGCGAFEDEGCPDDCTYTMEHWGVPPRFLPETRREWEPTHAGVPRPQSRVGHRLSRDSKG